jgi:hypothetical protein
MDSRAAEEVAESGILSTHTRGPRRRARLRYEDGFFCRRDYSATSVSPVHAGKEGSWKGHWQHHRDVGVRQGCSGQGGSWKGIDNSAMLVSPVHAVGGQEGFMERSLAWKCLLLVWAIVLITGGSWTSAIAAGQPAYSTLVVKMVSGLSGAEQSAVVARDGGVETSSVSALRLHIITVPTESLPLVQQNYQSDPQVERIELDKTRKAEGIPSDLDYGVQWALPKIGYDAVFGTVNPTGSAKVALLDTGVDASHPDLAGVIIPGISILDGSNGLTDSNGHGTALAGIVAALTNNDIGIAGVAWQGVHIMPVTVLDAGASGQDSAVIAGIVWAADHGADVIIMGFSNPEFSQNLQDAVDYAWSKGAVLVAAAGNDGAGTPTFPAGHRGVIGVSATDSTDALAYFSNYGQDVFLAAPGTDIYTTALKGTGSYMSGTSASSAIVGGVAAFMKVIDPSLTNGVIAGRLAKSAKAVGTAGDPSNQTYFGNGRIDMAAALADTSTEAVQPAGAAPVGSGGPYLGPYLAAAQQTPAVTVGPQSIPHPVYGQGGSATYTVTVDSWNSGNGTATLSISGLPTGVTASFDPTAVNFSNRAPSPTSTLTLTIGNGVAVGTSVFTVAAGGLATFKSGSGSVIVERASQTIAFGTAPTVAIGGSGTVSATGGASGTPVTFTTQTPAVCTVSGTNGSTVTGVTIGNCTIAANQAGNDNYSDATQVTQSFDIALASQTIAFGTAPAVVVGGSGTVSATGGASGNPVMFTTLTPAVCNVSGTNGSTVTGVTVGNCIIAANQAGNGNYSAATQATQSFAIDFGSQTIAFGTPPTITVGGSGTVSATGGASGNPVTFSTQTPAVCTVSGTNGSTVTGQTAGNCIIAANQAGNGNYSAATQATQSFAIGQGSQTIAFGTSPIIAVGGSGTVSATGGLSGNPVTFSTQTSAVCTVSGTNGSTVTGVTAGNCTIAANQAGNGNYSAAAQATQSFAIGQGSQSIAFGTSPTIAVGGSGTVSATGGASGNPVIFTTQTPAVCTVSGTNGSTVTGVTAGNCTIAANQAGNGNYSAAALVTQSFAIGQGSQTIAFGTSPTVAVGGSGTVSATGGASGNPVIFTTLTPAVCTVSGTNGSTVTGRTVGSCTIAANQAGNGNYSAATQATQSFAIGLGSQTIAFGTSPTIAVGGSGTVSATGGSSGNAVTFSTETPAVCDVSGTNGSTVTGVTAGNCTIAASQAGNGNYSAATPATQSFAIGLGSQTIAFGSAPTVAVGGSGTVSATGGPSGNPVTFTTQTPAVCTVSGTNGGTVTGVTAGNCTIAANQAGNGNYSDAAPATQSFAIGLGSQSIAFGTSPTIAVGGNGTVSATGGPSGNPVTFTTQTPAVCTVSGTNGGTVTGVTAGNCTIAANQAGNGNYSAAPPATQSFAIGLGSQTIAFGSSPTIAVGGSGTVSATGGASGNTVTFTTQTPAVCTVSGTNGSTVTGVTAGNCTIAANQQGNSNYSDATQVTQTFAIGLASQTITFGTAPAVVVGGSGTVSATGGASGNPVTFTTQTAAVCTVNGSTVTGVTVGNCTIAANQQGNSNYSDATQVSQTFAIGLTSQTITFGTAPAVVVGGSGTVSATGGPSGNAVTFTTLTPAVCNVSGTNGSTVTGVTAGNCTIAANQVGNGYYSAAPPASQSFAIGLGSQAIAFGSAPAVAAGRSATVSATGGASGNPVTFTSQTPAVCSVSGANGSTVTGVTVGNCTIAASQQGNSNFRAAATVTESFDIGMGSQTIAFDSAPTVGVGWSGTVSATGGGSGNPVTFTTQTPAVCTVGGTNGSTVTGITVGNCTIAANQAGNGNYSAATQATQSFAIVPASAGPTYTITASAGAGGSISPSGTVTVIRGSNQHFYIAPIAGYAIANLVVDGVSTGTGSTCNFLNITGSHTIVAYFAPIYTITATAGTGGSITPSGTLNATGGTNQYYNVSASAGYRVKDVVVDGVSVGAVGTYTFSNLSGSHTIAVSFVPTITATAASGGTISPSGSLVPSGNQTYTITANTGYKVSDVVVNGSSIGAVSSYTFTGVTTPQTISVTFATNSAYTITATAGTGGTISPAGQVSVNGGSDQHFNIAPSAGYAIANVVVDGVSQGTGSTWNFQNVTRPHTIVASFVPTITATAANGGSIAPSGNTPVPSGSQTYTITANTGYHVSDVVVNGSSIGAVSSYSFTGVTTPQSISVTFAN